MVRTAFVVDFPERLPSFRSDRNYKLPPVRSVDSAHETTAPLRAAVLLPLRPGQQPQHRSHRRGDKHALARSNPAAIQRQTPPAMNAAEGTIAAPNLRACFLTSWLRAKHPYLSRIATSGAYGEKQPIKFWHEERRTRSGDRWNSRQA